MRVVYVIVVHNPEKDFGNDDAFVGHSRQQVFEQVHDAYVKMAVDRYLDDKSDITIHRLDALRLCHDYVKFVDLLEGTVFEILRFSSILTAELPEEYNGN